MDKTTIRRATSRWGARCVLCTYRQGVRDPELFGSVPALLHHPQEVPPAEHGEQRPERVLQRRGFVVRHADALVALRRERGGVVRGVRQHRQGDGQERHARTPRVGRRDHAGLHERGLDRRLGDVARGERARRREAVSFPSRARANGRARGEGTRGRRRRARRGGHTSCGGRRERDARVGGHRHRDSHHPRGGKWRYKDATKKFTSRRVTSPVTRHFFSHAPTRRTPAWTPRHHPRSGNDRPAGLPTTR